MSRKKFKKLKKVSMALPALWRGGLSIYPLGGWSGKINPNGIHNAHC